MRTRGYNGINKQTKDQRRELGNLRIAPEALAECASSFSCCTAYLPLVVVAVAAVAGSYCCCCYHRPQRHEGSIDPLRSQWLHRRRDAWRATTCAWPFWMAVVLTRGSVRVHRAVMERTTAWVECLRWWWFWAFPLVWKECLMVVVQPTNPARGILSPILPVQIE